jgi:hypothetical protein
MAPIDFPNAQTTPAALVELLADQLTKAYAKEPYSRVSYLYIRRSAPGQPSAAVLVAEADDAPEGFELATAEQITAAMTQARIKQKLIACLRLAPILPI